ncbi:CDP-alcohol phosphatidyltransferase family protein [Candidatus Woesearchaeota archaeon]|jgi:phosphatidylglycerophosphate synthase|nr:CDP-alcohol phosphatidyltransferase family protein [Candidatus Woesearchaeota archaeon]
MVEKLSVLKKITKKKHGPYDKAPLDVLLIYMPIADYFTKLFLHLRFSANFVTFLMLILSAVAGILFAFPSHKNWILGAICIQFFFMFDNVDGNIARYRNTCSKSGHFLDLIHHVTAFPLIFIGLGVGLWVKTGSIFFLYLGFSNSFFFHVQQGTRAAYKEILKLDESNCNQLLRTKSKFIRILKHLTFGDYFTVMGGLILVGALLNTLSWFHIILGVLLPIRWVISSSILCNLLKKVN